MKTKETSLFVHFSENGTNYTEFFETSVEQDEFILNFFFRNQGKSGNIMHLIYTYGKVRYISCDLSEDSNDDTTNTLVDIPF